MHRRTSSASPARLGERMLGRGLESLSESTGNGLHRAMRSFNTSGPIDAQDHYHIPPLERMELDYVLDLIPLKKYFILHAPRQTGKTSTLKALQGHLNSGAEATIVASTSTSRWPKLLDRMSSEPCRRFCRCWLDGLGMYSETPPSRRSGAMCWPRGLRIRRCGMRCTAGHRPILGHSCC